MPAAHNVHPEFGLLCPTPRLRRRIRLALTCTVLALIGLAVLRASNHAPSAPRVAALEQDLGGTRPDGGLPPAPALAARSTLAESTEAGAAKTACAQDSSAHRIWVYLDGKCVTGKARRPRMVRVATDRPMLAAITIGTLVVAERAPEPVSPPASVSTGRQGDPLKSATATPADAAPMAEPPPRAAASKKPPKTARNHNRRRDPAGNGAPWWREVRADGWNARGDGVGERNYGRGGYAREGSYGSFGFFR
jgi:hypothetical protein